MKKINTREMTFIGAAIAVLIAGGYMIVQLTAALPIVGVKYMVIAPYLAMTLYIIMNKIDLKYDILIIGAVLSGLLSMINLYMAVAIITTSLMTQIMIISVTNRKTRSVIGCLSFSFFTGFISILISKYLIGGVFLDLPLSIAFIIGGICTLTGAIGILIGKKLMKHLNALYVK